MVKKKVFLNIYINNYEYVKSNTILHSVFHRILDFKAGLDFYPAPYFKQNHRSNKLKLLKMNIL